MLEVLCNLAVGGTNSAFRNFRNNLINENEEIEIPVEYEKYRIAITKITLAAMSSDYNKYLEAQESIASYKDIVNSLKEGKIYYGGNLEDKNEI